MRVPMVALTAMLAGALAFAGGRARADADDNLRVMRVRFAEGQLYEAAGRWADALERFVDVSRVHNTSQVQFHTALCMEHLGRLLEAERLYKSARGAARNAPEVVSESDAHLADLQDRMPKVNVGVSGEPRGVTVMMDAAPVNTAAVMRVDPGPHLVTAMRDGRTISAVAFSILERRTKTVTLVVYPDR